jgi:hypothetical protein
MAGNIHKSLSNVYGNAAVDMSNVGRRVKRMRAGGEAGTEHRIDVLRHPLKVTIAVYWD